MSEFRGPAPQLNDDDPFVRFKIGDSVWHAYGKPIKDGAYLSAGTVQALFADGTIGVCAASDSAPTGMNVMSGDCVTMRNVEQPDLTVLELAMRRLAALEDAFEIYKSQFPAPELDEALDFESTAV